MTYTPEMRGVSFEVAKDLKQDGWNARLLHIYSHSGTHMDAPVHFGVEGPTIDQFSAEELIVDCWVVNLSGIESKALITVGDLGDIPSKWEAGQGLILRTGWSDKVNSTAYRDDLPRISEELARWCADHKVKLLGVEPPSVADVNNMEEVTKIHQILFKGEVIIVEGLTNLDAIQSEKVEVIALPLKIKGGDGAPARVIAIEKSDL